MVKNSSVATIYISHDVQSQTLLDIMGRGSF